MGIFLGHQRVPHLFIRRDIFVPKETWFNAPVSPWSMVATVDVPPKPDRERRRCGIAAGAG